MLVVIHDNRYLVLRPVFLTVICLILIHFVTLSRATRESDRFWVVQEICLPVAKVYV